MSICKPFLRLVEGARRFSKDEDGDILMMSVFMFILMVAFGGISVDLANYERHRSFIQNNLDNATLAAASLSQNLAPEGVVRSYLEAAGVDTASLQVTSSENSIGGVLIGRTVEASISGDLKTFFMRMLGQDTLAVGIRAAATEYIDNVEISLVLDVSGSMGMDGAGNPDMRKISTLRRAAISFVDMVLSNAEKNRISISVIPYSTKVNAGPDLLAGYTVSNEHDYSHCVDFGAADYRTLRIEPTQPLQRTGHFQFQAFSAADPKAGQWTCRVDNGFMITPLSQDKVELVRAIEALTPEGSTSIDMGAKWGLALLDPSANNPVRGLVSKGRVDGIFSDRPLLNDAPDSMKVLVIMTDGENDTEFRLRPNYASGLSPIYRTMGVDGAAYYSVDAVEVAGADDADLTLGERFFYGKHPKGADRRWEMKSIGQNPGLRSLTLNGSEKRLSWPEVWAEMSPIWSTYNLMSRQLNDQGAWGSDTISRWKQIHSTIGTGQKDLRLQDICNAAREKGIITYTVGFEVASASSLELLKNCASTEAHYFDVAGIEMESAFEMIASSIGMLRLTK
jgi:Flp pilus assembly protein TadG